MSKVEKENRINSLAVTFLERQRIIPNLFADQIIRGYKEGYHQAEKDLNDAREELMKKACEYLDGLIEFLNDHRHGLNKERIIGGLKQAMKDE